MLGRDRMLRRGEFGTAHTHSLNRRTSPPAAEKPLAVFFAVYGWRADADLHDRMPTAVSTGMVV